MGISPINKFENTINIHFEGIWGLFLLTVIVVVAEIIYDKINKMGNKIFLRQEIKTSFQVGHYYCFDRPWKRAGLWTISI